MLIGKFGLMQNSVIIRFGGSLLQTKKIKFQFLVAECGEN